MVCLAGLLLLGAGSDSVAFKYGVAFMLEPILIAALLLSVMYWAAAGGGVAKVVNNALLVHIGQISYCMYLFHGLIGYTTARIVSAYSDSYWIGFAAEYAAVAGFAAISYRFYETPVRRLIAGSAAH